MPRATFVRLLHGCFFGVSLCVQHLCFQTCPRRRVKSRTIYINTDHELIGPPLRNGGPHELASCVCRKQTLRRKPRQMKHCIRSFFVIKTSAMSFDRLLDVLILRLRKTCYYKSPHKHTLPFFQTPLIERRRIGLCRILAKYRKAQKHRKTEK